MPPKPKKYYAVRVGKHPGIYITWPEAQKEVSGFVGALYKSFTTLPEAQEYMHTGIDKLRGHLASDADMGKGKSKDLDELLDADATGMNPSGENPQSAADEILRTCKTIQADIPNAIERSPPDTWTYHHGEFYLATDGSFNTRSRRSGWAVYLGPSATNLIQPMPLDTTNNRCELLAIQAALKCILAHIGHPKLQSGQIINIVSDSQLCVNTFTKWLPNWKKKGWKLASGDTPKNLEEVQAIDRILDDLQKPGRELDIRFIHQRAHTSGQTTKFKTHKDELLWQINYIVDILAQQLTN